MDHAVTYMLRSFAINRLNQLLLFNPVRLFTTVLWKQMSAKLISYNLNLKVLLTILFASANFTFLFNLQYITMLNKNITLIFSKYIYFKLKNIVTKNQLKHKGSTLIMCIFLEPPPSFPWM